MNGWGHSLIRQLSLWQNKALHSLWREENFLRGRNGMRKKVWGILFVGFLFFFFGGIKGEARVDLPINTISGTVFQDVNKNGVLDLNRFEISLRGQKVELYQSLAAAINEESPLKSSTTNSLGVYSFTSLRQGTYYLKFGENNGEYTAVSTSSSVVDEVGTAWPNVVEVNVNSESRFYSVNLPLAKNTRLFISPFNDINMNGLRESEEPISNGKTMIAVDIQRFAQALRQNDFSGIDLNGLLSSSVLSGNVDLPGGVYLRTTTNDASIELSQLSTGSYLMLRSPFNLTINDLLGNQQKIQAIITLITNGNISELLDNPELLSTGDMDTSVNQDYIRKLADLFVKIGEEVEAIDFDSLLGSTELELGAQVSRQLYRFADVLNALPAYRWGIISYYGQVFDVTDFRVAKTNDFEFGIKNYAAISGTVYLDTDNNGTQGSWELAGRDAIVTAYDAWGNELGSAETSTVNQFYNLTQLPYDQQIYLGIETDRPVTPGLNANELPDSLKEKRIVGTYVIPSDAVDGTIVQRIGVMGTVPSSVTMGIKSIDYENQIVTLAAKNTDRTRQNSLTVQLNDGTISQIVLPRAPIIGNPSDVIFEVEGILPEGENRLTTYWESGVYRIYLSDLLF